MNERNELAELIESHHCESLNESVACSCGHVYRFGETPGIHAANDILAAGYSSDHSNEYDMLERHYAAVEAERDQFHELYNDVAEENRRLRAALTEIRAVAEHADRQCGSIDPTDLIAALTKDNA